MSLFDDVGGFNAKFDLPHYGDGGYPCLLTDEQLMFRVGHMREELDEFMEATREGKLPEAADALIDLVYVALGAAHWMRIPFDAVWREVHAANMRKVRSNGPDDPRGKRGSGLDVVKPLGWRPPDVAAVLLDRMCSASGWDRRFMGLAEHVAEWSKDPSTKVGAVLVGVNRHEVCHGYNGFPPGVADTPERLTDRSTKYKLIQHAERNALDNARFDVAGATLYVTRYPCSECAKSIVSKRLKQVICPPPPDYEPWASDVKWTELILREGDVPVRYAVGFE